MNAQRAQSANISAWECAWHVPLPPVISVRDKELRPAQKAADDCAAEADVVHEAKLSPLVGNIEQARCLHRTSPYERASEYSEVKKMASEDSH